MPATDEPLPDVFSLWHHSSPKNLHFTRSNLSIPAHTKKHSRRFCFRTVHCCREQWHPMREIANGQVMWPASGRAKQPGTAAKEQKSGRCIHYTPGMRGGCPRRHERATLGAAHPARRRLQQRPLHTVSRPMDQTKPPPEDLRPPPQTPYNPIQEDTRSRNNHGSYFWFPLKSIKYRFPENWNRWPILPLVLANWSTGIIWALCPRLMPMPTLAMLLDIRSGCRSSTPAAGAGAGTAPTHPRHPTTTAARGPPATGAPR
jgi:hypothetical protein